ncbi:topoisomerase DNA-binding C4 zinc finger domain-containing protein [Stieleria varia]
MRIRDLVDCPPEFIHNRKDRQDRDAFLDRALNAAGLAILHIKAARTYSIREVQQRIASVLPGTACTLSAPPPLPAESSEPSCPKCHTAMVQRKAAKGPHACKRFWACTNYPRCREIIGID